MRRFVWAAAAAAVVTVGGSGGAGQAPPPAKPAAKAPAEVAYLGAEVGPLVEGGLGVVVRGVPAGSPAAAAGLRAGDRVRRVGGQDVNTVDQFLKAVAGKKPGDKLEVVVDRGGQEQALTAALTGRAPEPPAPARPAPDRPANGPAYLGVRIEALNPDNRERVRAKAAAGVLLADVLPGSAAEKAGLEIDDVVVAVGGKPVATPEELRRALQAAGAGKEVAIEVDRAGEKKTLRATPRAEAPAAPDDPFQFVLPFPLLDPPGAADQARRIRDLEKRVAELEKRLLDLERKLDPAKK